MTRRSFVIRASVLGLAAAGLTFVSGCERLLARTTARVGFLSGEAQDSAIAVTPQNLDVFRTSMQPDGWNEGQNLIVDVRYAAGQTERLPGLADELARLPMDVIVGYGVPVAEVLQNAKLSTPVVMIGLVDPVAAGIVDSP